MTEPVTVEKFAIGQSVRRLEDPRLIQGLGRYSDDVSLPREAHAVLARSPHGHARVRAIDTRAALKAPGVLAVLTAAELAADGGARLHRRGGHARHDEIDAGHVGGAGEGAVDGLARAGLGHERDVVGHLVPHRRGAGPQRVGGAGDGGPRLVVDEDARRAVGSLLRRLGYDKRQRIPDVADAPAYESRPRCGEGRRPVATLPRAVGREIAEAVGCEIGARQSRHHPG